MSMKKKLSFIALTMVLVLSACGATQEDEQEVAQKEAAEAVNETLSFNEKIKLVLELADEPEFTDTMTFRVVFGNGEELSTKIECIAMPRRTHGRDWCAGLDYQYFYNLSVDDVYLVWLLKDNLEYALPEMSVKLYPSEIYYSLNEAYYASFDSETLTFSAYVWRDEPYIAEREAFDRGEWLSEIYQAE